MQTWNAGGTAGLLQYIRERSDDIEKAVIPQHLSIVMQPTGERVEAGLVLHLVSEEVLLKLPLLPSQHTMEMMAKAATAVYEGAVEEQHP